MIKEYIEGITLTKKELSEIAEKMEEQLEYNRKNNIKFETDDPDTAVPEKMYIELDKGKVVAITTSKNYQLK